MNDLYNTFGLSIFITWHMNRQCSRILQLSMYETLLLLPTMEERQGFAVHLKKIFKFQLPGFLIMIRHTKGQYVSVQSSQVPVKVKFPITGHKRPEVEYRYNSTLSLTLVLDGGWVINAMPRPLYPHERPSTNCIVGWVGARADLDGCRKSRPHWASIPGPSSPQQVPIPTELSWPTVEFQNHRQIATRTLVRHTITKCEFNGKEKMQAQEAVTSHTLTCIQ
jgi:hypothetical protein